MKKSQLERAIDALDQEITVLQLAKAKLVQQQTKAPARRPRPRAVPAKSEQSA